MKFFFLLLSVAFLALPGFAQNSRKIVSTPTLQPPAEAVESGLGGRVNVQVEVNNAGDVTEAKQVDGPDWVCPNVKRPDVVAIQQTAKTVSMQIKYAPQDKGSTEWIGITFPSKKPSEEPNAEKEPEPEAGGGVTVTRKRPAPRLIKGGVLNGRATNLARPPYPPEARAERAAGAVAIQVLIDEDGKIFSAEPVSGHPLLRTASRWSACNSQFSPTKLEGKPVKVSGVITYNFVP